MVCGLRVAAGALLLLGCRNVLDESPSARALSCAGGVRLEFSPDIPAGTEGYQCFAYAVELLQGGEIRALHWTEPDGSAVLHHATLRATSELRPTDGPFDCDPMPEDAVTI